MVFKLTFAYFCFIIINFALASHEPNVVPGRTTLVHLFEWKWYDIAIECEQFLGPYGYGGVQVSPPNENVILNFSDVQRPWYERYQSVSYKLETRSGTEQEFKDMVKRCNNVGVRIYVDAIINHMTGNVGKSHGTGGSFFDSNSLFYDEVPYGPTNFHDHTSCPTSSGNIEDWNNKIQLRNCRLVSLADLNTTQEYVRDKLSGYMNHLIDIGVGGFRVDAAKHMSIEDLTAIYGKLKNLSQDFFPAGSRPFIYQEVPSWGGSEEVITSQDYVHLGRVTEFRYGLKLANVIRKNNFEHLSYLKNYGEGWAFLKGNDAVIFIDNHDNQRSGIGSILTYRESRMYKIATAFMLAWPYGLPRVMSSFDWPRNIVHGRDENDWFGPPHDSNYNIKNVTRNSDLTCGNGWICEHRWRQIYNMMKFRNAVLFAEVSNWWDNGYHQIAFARNGRGFIAINNENAHDLRRELQTSLSEGTYCDVISGIKQGNQCTGKSIYVNSTGHTEIFIPYASEDPMIAIHFEAKL